MYPVTVRWQHQGKKKSEWSHAPIRPTTQACRDFDLDSFGQVWDQEGYVPTDWDQLNTLIHQKTYEMFTMQRVLFLSCWQSQFNTKIPGITNVVDQSSLLHNTFISVPLCQFTAKVIPKPKSIVNMSYSNTFRF